ncbi:hypothetical protein EDD15DRAFT_2368613 [Pisolithus albus]|nr:hypothetical protein EDD15DRAFT_2368613 [Pisolithus albus]
MAMSLDLNLFSVPTLQTDEGQHDAFEHLNEVLDVSHIEDVVCDLLSKPGLFVYILSVFPDAAFLRTKILDAFPTDPQVLQQSFVPPLLSTISSFFFSIPSDTFHGDESRTIGRYERYNADVWPAMAVLSSIAFETAAPRRSRNAGFKERKTAHDFTALRKLNIQPPTDSSIAMRALGDVVDVVLQMMKFYLALSADPRFMDRCMDVYFGASGERDAYEDSGDVLPLACTQTHHLEATLAASDIDRFGEWTILMASNATKDLLQLRRRDAKMAECVLKRIRYAPLNPLQEDRSKRSLVDNFQEATFQEIIPEHFTGRRTNPGNANEDVIKYQIDCVLDDEGQVERQEVVKIYGIYPHKQLDHIWPWLSRLLSGRGKVYQQRCTLREFAKVGGGVYRPATFPPRREEFTTDQSPVFVHDDGTNEDHSWLISSKCVKLSKAYLNGLIAEQEVELPFQLTRKEWQIVQCPTSCYVIGRSGTGKTTAMVFKMLGIHRAWEQVSDVRKPRQLFVTRFPVLAAKVNEFFTSLVESLALAGRTRDELRELRSQVRNAEHQESPMMNPMNALNYRPGTPQKYSELTDHDFPLFITFDQVDDLKEYDCPIDSKECARLKFILDRVVNDESSFVTYSAFRSHYWPRLCATSRSPLACSFGPWLVFSEFMGVIKGSEAAFHSPNGILDRHTYVNLSTRTYPVFAGDRHSLYSAFELYSQLKREKYAYDMADRTYAILKALSCNPLKGQPVDYLYVDEVQDNLIIDTILLRILCQNADGLFWAGDTAQTISAGSSFRFAELKAFIHRTEEARNMAIQKSHRKPELFDLPVNYRSHRGIVNCAQVVVKLVTDFWPDSIDTLQPERAIFGGPKPVFFAGWPNESFPFEPASRELGAEQCILVRDNTVREQIRKRFGDVAVILTLEASKGLEFDDVFLYNFFEDPIAASLQWHIVSMAHGDRDVLLSRDMGRSPHTVLCTELKNLYVGITRARKKLYLLDHSEKSEPMRELWSKKDLIDVAPPGTNICQYADKSTPRQWAAAGHKLFNACQFQEAVHCFERANLPKQLRIAQAYGLYEIANSTVESSERQRAFLDAAVAFVQCADEALGTEKKGFFRQAAECYASADDATMAAELYVAASDFAGAAEQYRKAGCFDELVQILDRHPTEITGSYRNKMLYICVVYYSRNGLRPPIPLFSSTDIELAFLESQGLNEERIDLLESLGRFLEAAEVHLAVGQRCGAIESLLKDQQNLGALQRAVDLALESLWQECSFDQPVQAILKNRRSEAYKVLNCLQAIPLERLEISKTGQIRFFRAVQQSPFSEEVYQLGEEFSNRGEEAMALMAFNVLSSQLAALHSADAAAFDNFLRRFERYVRLLTSIVTDEIPFRATDPEVMKVFGIIPSTHHNYSVIAGTFLHKQFEHNRYLPAEINGVLKAWLQTHLRKKFEDENDVSRISLAFSTQCPYSIMHGSHRGRQQCNQQHERGLYSNAASYNMKINLLLQQIRISDLVFSAVGNRGDF